MLTPTLTPAAAGWAAVTARPPANAAPIASLAKLFIVPVLCFQQVPPWGGFPRLISLRYHCLAELPMWNSFILCSCETALLEVMGIELPLSTSIRCYPAGCYMRFAFCKLIMPAAAVALASAFMALPLAQAAAPLAPRGTYVLDPDHTQIVFGIRHMGISTF